MRKELSLINKCKSWKECNQHIAKLTTGRQTKLGGSVFECVVKLYLQTEPKYQTKFKQVWLLDEVPYKIKKYLNLPRADEGIDLIVKTNEDEYWSVQAKYRSDINETLVFGGKGGLSTFLSLSFVTCKNISHSLICATVNKPPIKKHLLKNIGFEVADTWLSLDDNEYAGWKRIQAKAKGKTLVVKPTTPRPHQRDAIKEAKKHFLTSKNSRGKMIMPCGTGKSLASFWIAHKLKTKNIIVAVPSIALIKQTLNIWANESILNKRKIDWLCVCSDESVDNDQDEIVSNTSDLGIKPTTNQKEIEKFLKYKTKNLKVIFTTYQSGAVTAKAARKTKNSFDLGLFDEAHKTVGHKDKQMAHLIFEKNIKIKKRLFMTATERLFNLNNEDYLSMDNKNNYGEIFYQLSFKKAISSKPPIISDYKVITINVNEEIVKSLIEKNKFLKLRKKIDNITARELAVGIALGKAIKKLKIKNTLTFHSSIKRANSFSSQQDLIAKLYPQFGKLESFHIHGGMNASERSILLKEFGNSPKSLMTNARCLTEGIDLPSIDCVCFTDPKRSKTDIVQAVGRALRLSKGKKFGYILIPVSVSKNKSSQIITNDSRFDDIITIVGALSSQDERISDYLSAISMGHKPKTSTPIDGLTSIKSYSTIDKDYFGKSINLIIWDKIAAFNYVGYEKCKQLAISNNIKKAHEYFKFIRLNKKTYLNYPSSPHKVYKNNGWENWGEFLNTKAVASMYKGKLSPSYKDAKAILSKYKFKTVTQYQKNLDSNELRNYYLPWNPKVRFEKDWGGWSDYLGTKIIATIELKNSYPSYADFKKIIQKLKIKSINEYKKLHKLNKLPKNLPLKIQRAYPEYKKDGKRILFGIKYENFVNAKKVVKKLKIKSASEYKKYSEILLKKYNMPISPNFEYKRFWISWADFLDTKNLYYKNYLSFEKARKFVRKLNLKNVEDWKNYFKKNQPDNLPAKPQIVYKDKWKGSNDYFGTKNHSKNKKFLSYDNAKKIMKKYKLKSATDFKYFKKRPLDIPYNPKEMYENSWKGWNDFLSFK